MKKDIKNILIDFSALENKKILVCVSGGMDSIYLYHRLLEHKEEYKFDIAIAHVNYQTTKNSDRASELCRRLSVDNNHSFYLKNYKIKQKRNFEHLARECRYLFFEDIRKKDKYDYIATAHNKNDLLETLYMRGKEDDFTILPYSLNPKVFLRPLLETTREEIQTYIESNNIEYVEDPTNKDMEFRRNKVRLDIFPNLKDSQKVFEDLMRIYKTKLLKYQNLKDSYTLDKSKYICYDKKISLLKVDRRFLLSQSCIYSFKLILQLAIKDNFNVSVSKSLKSWKEFYRQVDTSQSNNSKQFLDSLWVCLDKSFIYFYIKSNSLSCKPLKDNLKWGNGKFLVEKSSILSDSITGNKNIFYIPEKEFDKGLYVRRWFTGDKMVYSENKSKLVSDIFNDKAVMPFLREGKPIIVQDDNIKWMPGLEICYNDFIRQENLVRIEWNEN